MSGLREADRSKNLQAIPAAEKVTPTRPTALVYTPTHRDVRAVVLHGERYVYVGWTNQAGNRLWVNERQAGSAVAECALHTLGGNTSMTAIGYEGGPALEATIRYEPAQV